MELVIGWNGVYQPPSQEAPREAESSWLARPRTSRLERLRDPWTDKDQILPGEVQAAPAAQPKRAPATGELLKTCLASVPTPAALFRPDRRPGPASLRWRG